MSRLTDNEVLLNSEVSSVKEASRPLSRRNGWAEIALPLGAVLAVSIPVMVVEEGWHRRPMIDEGSYLWILPVVLVTSAFWFGGALAGFRCPSSAVAHASVVASISLVVLLLGAVFRRVWIVHEGTQNAVLRLWLLGVVGSLALCIIGSLFGRRLAKAQGSRR